ncbi:hypothetical protein ACFSO7_08630 [Bacillus sp. CGMCC 1.16607]|uniref:hypothetical protein n=1 Tax=Bacillus sp. CGMCC 1.16607 TaxID=3351842 RepID=UPI0036350D0F
MYIGNSKYCYANSTSMLLQSVGESISPEKIEVLTGMGLGAVFEGDYLFLDSSLPDIGITKALTTLGFTFEECVEESPDHAPYDRLKDILRESSVIVGPVDLGYFTHLPNHKYLHGADHYVLVYDIDDQYIYFHDPAGYPYMLLPLDQFQKAWKAENIQHSRGYFRFWHSAKRQSHPSEEEIYRKAIVSFQTQYLNTEKKNFPNGSEAILEFSRSFISEDIPIGIIAHVTHFLFQLGAKRAIDFAHFFKDHHPELFELKIVQAKLLGRCHVLATHERWNELTVHLQQLATAEHEFRNKLMKITFNQLKKKF